MENKTLYLVTTNGWNEGWGCEIYCVGIFEDKDKANKAAKKNMGEVHIVEVNKCYDMKKEDSVFANGSYYNDLYLGGYIE